METVDRMPPKALRERHSKSVEDLAVVQILKKNGIRVTQNRVELLNILNDARHPLNQKDIEEQLSTTPDRVTLYRNLRFFVDHKIIHKIEINGSLTSYSVNRTHIDHGHSAEHLHFYCSICHKVTCMPQHGIKKYDLPDGFSQQSSKLIVNGICNICNKEKIKSQIKNI